MSRRAQRRLASPAIILVLALAGCDAAAPRTPAAVAAARPAPCVVVRPPAEVEAVIDARAAAHADERGIRTTVVYLNFEGGALKAGMDSNARLDTSFLVPADLDYPAFDAAPYGADRAQVIAQIVAGLEDLFAGFDVRFTTTRPTTGSYMMTMVGGRMDVIGQADGTLGVSPLDCRPAPFSLDPNPLDINFIFAVSCAESGLNLQDLIYVIAHENAHTYGLGHIEREGDIMFWATAGNEQLSWGAGPMRSGEQSCSVDGSQDDLEYLSIALGGHQPRQETTPPAVSITSPAHGATMADTWEAAVDATDESGVLRVEMYSNGDFWNMAAEAPYTFYFRAMSPGVYALRARAIDWYANAAVSPIVTVIVPKPAPATCTSDPACGQQLRCQKGVCVDPTPPPAAGDLGAACADDVDCGAGPCFAASSKYCSQGCREDAGIYCPFGFACGADYFCHSIAGTPPGGLGATCTANESCQHGVCAGAAEGKAGYCTQACVPGGEACAGGGGCVTLDQGATHVCGRPSSGGCAAAPGGAGPLGVGVALALGLVLGLG
ncbi:MAG TPA: Ig-like domain-containing protein, partial [Polyangia bacterium]